MHGVCACATSESKYSAQELQIKYNYYLYYLYSAVVSTAGYESVSPGLNPGLRVGAQPTQLFIHLFQVGRLMGTWEHL